MPPRLTRLFSLAAVLVLSAATPSAAGGFGSYGDGAGQFIEAHGIAVEQRHGGLYVLDSYNHRVEKYTKDGRFLFAWGWGVADGRTHAPQRCTQRCFAGLAGDGAGQLSFTEGIAVDNDPHSPSYGDVYVVDIGNHRVQKYSATGGFLLMFGGRVNRTAHQRHQRADEGRCPVNPGDRCRAGLAGAAPGQFEFGVEGNFIAVGAAGTVYVGDRNRIEEFHPDGSYRTQILLPAPAGASAGRELGGISGLTLDADGDMYVIRNGVSGIREYDPTGRPLQTFDDKGWPSAPEEPAPAIESDPPDGLFVDAYEYGEHRILRYDSAGRLVASFDSGMEDGIHGLAYNPDTKQLYIINTNNNATPHTARIRITTPPSSAAIPILSLLAWLARW
jgi:DNA-binding beta-propeller fold protein YncE